MRLVVVGCEYAGKTKLVMRIAGWWKEKVGAELPVHDHFTYPLKGGDGGVREVGDEELAKLEALGPVGRELFQRYLMDYHLGPGFAGDDDLVLVGFHIEDAVYAPLYYGYGQVGIPGDRERFARHTDYLLMKDSPDTVLVLVKASAETIRKRMKEAPHIGGVLREEDVETVLKKFDEEYWKSFIRRKFILDTSDTTEEETFKQFLKSMEPYFRPIDSLRMIQHKFLEEETR